VCVCVSGEGEGTFDVVVRCTWLFSYFPCW